MVSSLSLRQTIFEDFVLLVVGYLLLDNVVGAYKNESTFLILRVTLRCFHQPYMADGI